MLYVALLVLAGGIVFLSLKLSSWVDAMDGHKGLTGAFIGGVLLAAATSLPELFTSLTAVIALNDDSLVLGNILGSNIFNLFVLGLLLLIFYKRYDYKKIQKSHKTVALFGLLIMILVLGNLLTSFDLVFLGVSIISVIILVLYGISMRALKTDEGITNEKTTGTQPQSFLRFILLSMGILVISIALTYTVDAISTEINLAKTVAGALILGVVTSLPELVSSFDLARRRNFNAVFGNILGSNLFNFTILSVSDMVYRKGSVYVSDASKITLATFTFLAIVLGWGLARHKQYAKGFGLALVLIYLLYLFFS